MIKTIILFLFTLPCLAENHRLFEIAIINSDVTQVTQLLNRPISLSDKKKYQELAKEVREQCVSNLGNGTYKKIAILSLGSLSLFLALYDFHDAFKQIDELDDLRKKDVVIDIVRGSILGSVGINLIYYIYKYYVKNKKYYDSIAVEMLLSNTCPIECN
jgi:hypothetical protein